MRFVEEVVVDEFLPTFRALLAADLRDRGLTQSEVADLLGISQSAVSKYAQGDVETNERVAADDRVTDLVERLGTGLASGAVTPVQALAEAEVLIRQLEQGDLLAQLHEDDFPPLGEYDSEFSIHDPDSRLRESERVLASVRRAVRALENTSGFATLVPAVGTNVAEALPGASGIDDVAAVPGRVVDVKGRATVPDEPEFGVSEHVAGVLLAARRGGSDARAAINVRFEPDIVSDLADQGREPVEFDAEVPADEAVELAVRDSPDADVVYQTGGFGVEPIVYVLASDAVAAAETVRALC